MLKNSTSFKAPESDPSRANSEPFWGNCGTGWSPRAYENTKRAGERPVRPEMSDGLLSERSPVRLWPGAPTQESRSGRPMGSSPALLFCRR